MTRDGVPDAGAVYDAYLAAVRRGERRAAFAVIDEAARHGLPLGDVYVRVFQPTLREIGRLWQHNEITVADEHLATAITQAAMARLYSQAIVAESDAANTLLAACADNERHEVGLRMLCDLLECEGWDTTYLGATVPVESLLAMVKQRRPDVLALSAALPPHLPRLRDTIRAVRTRSAPPGRTARRSSSSAAARSSTTRRSARASARTSRRPTPRRPCRCCATSPTPREAARVSAQS